MSQSHTITDHHIEQAISALQDDGKNVTAWAVQEHLGGGNFDRIEQLVIQSQTAASTTTHHTSDSQDDNAQSILTDDIIDRTVPADIESTMSNMQNALGDMANKIWSEAANKAEEKVREKLFSAQQAHESVKKAYLETQSANQEMQATLANLNSNLAILEENYQESQQQLASERQALQKAEQERAALAKDVTALTEDNQLLEQTAFDAKLNTAKAEGLAQTIKEQLSLVKASEKQLQSALDRSEKKVNELTIELHDMSKNLREEVRDKLAAEQELKQLSEQLSARETTAEHPPSAHSSSEKATSQEAPAKAAEQPVPKNSATQPALDSVKPAQQPADATSENQPTNSSQLPSTQTKQQTGRQISNTGDNNGEPAVLKPSISYTRTRSLSEKLFEKKKNSPRSHKTRALRRQAQFGNEQGSNK